MTVIAAGELDDDVPAGRRARETERAHRRLRAGADEPDLLDRRHGVHERSRELDLTGRRRPEAGPVAGALAQRADDRRMRVAEDHGSPRPHHVEIRPAVRVDDLRAARALDEERAAADRVPRAHRAVHAARHHTTSLRVELLGRRRHARATVASDRKGVKLRDAERFLLQRERWIAYTSRSGSLSIIHAR